MKSSLSDTSAIPEGGHTKTATYRSFSDNVKAVGPEDAMKITRLEHNTMVAVHAFANQHGIDCDSKRCQTVDVFYDAAQWQAAMASVALMEKLMGSNAPKHIFHNGQDTAAEFLAEGSIGGLEYESGSLSAYKFTIGMLKLALQKGLNLQCNTPAHRIAKTSDGTSNNGKWRVETSRGVITTPKLVLATNGYTAHLLPQLQGVVVPLRGVITAQRPGQHMPQTGLETTYSFVHKGDFEYMISRPAGSRYEGDIVIGGGMHVAKDDGLAEYGNTDDTTYDEASARYLLECTKTRYFKSHWGPDHPDGQCRKVWSGVMGFSSDGYPLVGPVPDEDGLYVDVSFQGHGMVLCFLCARAAANMILSEGDQEDKDLDDWFPRCYRVTKGRLKRKFTGKEETPVVPEPHL